MQVAEWNRTKEQLTNILKKVKPTLHKLMGKKHLIDEKIHYICITYPLLIFKH